MTSAALDFDTLYNLRGHGTGTIRRPCPLCSHTRSRRHQKAPCLTTWEKGGGTFLTYSCKHCGAKGYAVREGTARMKVDHGRQSVRSSPDDDELRQRMKARWMWARSKPAIGTIAETYLRSRNITCAIPNTVRFLAPYKPEHHPAMLVPYALASEPEPGVLHVEENDITTVHLTKLTPNGAKADIDEVKITVGSPAGQPLVLAPMNDLMGLAVTEGIEDALSVHQSAGLGAWAAGSASFMPALVTAIEAMGNAAPDCISIFEDDNDAGRRGARGLAHGLYTLSHKLTPNGHFEILLTGGVTP